MFSGFPDRLIEAGDRTRDALCDKPVDENDRQNHDRDDKEYEIAHLGKRQGE